MSNWPLLKAYRGHKVFSAGKQASCHLLSEQVALDVYEGLPDLGDRSESRLCVVRAAIPDAQEIPDLPERQLLDALRLVGIMDMVQKLAQLQRIAQDRLTALNRRAARERALSWAEHA